MKAFVSWSGGKETSLAFYRATRNKDVAVSRLLNMVSEDGKHCCSHGINSKLLQRQAEAIGVPLIQRRATWDTYEREFKKAISHIREENINTGIFGDIDIQAHKDWEERVCKEEGLGAVLPLWNGKREELLDEFIKAGFKAVIVVTNANYLGEEWLGREINKEFIEDVRAMGKVDLCGEKGEYHTFVYDGPIFKNPVQFNLGEKIFRDNYWFLDLV